MLTDVDPVIDRLVAACQSFPEAVVTLSHGHPVAKAGERGKVFAVVGGGVKGEASRRERALLVKPAPEDREALEADARFWLPAYYGPAGWLGIDVDEHSDWQEICELLDASYRSVAIRRLTALLDARDQDGEQGAASVAAHAAQEP